MRSRTAAAARAGRLPARRSIVLLACLAIACGSTGAAPARKPRGRPPEKAWMSARSMCILPLAGGELPRTGGQLTRSLLGAWKEGLTLPDPARVVDIEGGRYPAVDTMRVDLTGAAAIPNRKSAKLNDPVRTTHSLAVNHFAMVAEPMRSGKAKVNLSVTGTNVRFDLQHDKDGRPLLMLADAAEGSLHFDLSRTDLERIMLAAAKEEGARHAVAVRSVDVDLRSLGPRSLTADVHVSTLVAFIPAGIRFTARVDIDDRMNARISNLTVDGDEILGPLIVGLIRPGMAKYNGQTKPLLSFPSGGLRLKDVQIDAGERVALTATFGR